MLGYQLSYMHVRQEGHTTRTQSVEARAWSWEAEGSGFPLAIPQLIFEVHEEGEGARLRIPIRKRRGPPKKRKRVLMMTLNNV